MKAFAITGAVMANEEGERNMGSRAGHWGAGSSGPKAQKPKSPKAQKPKSENID